MSIFLASLWKIPSIPAHYCYTCAYCARSVYIRTKYTKLRQHVWSIFTNMMNNYTHILIYPLYIYIYNQETPNNTFIQ